MAGFGFLAALVFALAACSNPAGGEDPDHYTLSFDSQGGTEVTAVTAEPGTAIPQPDEPTRAEHSFQGWHSAASGGTLYTWPHTLNADITMYARWEANAGEQYTLSFDSQGGTELTAVTADPETSVPKPDDPAKANHSFQGWYSAASGGTLYTWPHTLNADITMYARWQENAGVQYTITFDSQGGTELTAVTADPGTSVPQPDDPAKANHSFQGWHSAASGGTLHTWPHTLNADITMYARWQEDELPALTGTVALTGTAQVGLSLLANTGDLGGSGTISYQWQRSDSASGNFADISGATDSSYALVAADLDKYVRVTVSRAGNSGTVSSSPAGAVVPQPSSTKNIVIGFNYGAITIAGNDGTNVIYKTSAVPAALALSAAGYTGVKWHVDGDDVPAGTGSSITLEASAYSARTHSIAFIGTRDGKLYSQAITFTVRN
jgi:uncharacterized repeat protein (TIGR02543 family)